MTLRVRFSPEARRDLFALYDYIAHEAGPARAMGYIGRIEEYCLGFADAPERGTRRDDIRSGLRTVGFEGRVLIAFDIGPDGVTIDRILYGGRDTGRALRRPRRTRR